MTRRNIFKDYALLLSVYVVLTLAVPADQAALGKYGLSVLQGKLLSLSILIPLAGIWFAAFYGSAKLKEYASRIKSTSEGKAFNYIANGLTVLAYGLALSSIISSILALVARFSSNLLPMSVITRNYLTLTITLVGFILIDRGAKDLARTAKIKMSTYKSALIKISILLMAAGYTFLALSDPARRVAMAGGRAAYYLPDWLIVATIIVPYLYVWYSGLSAGILIGIYRRSVEGVIYKQFLAYLSYGIVTIILSQVFLQLFGSTSSGLGGLSLGAILALVYALLIIISIGYILVALAAKKLKKIEEV